MDEASYRKPSGQEQIEDPDTINGDVQAEGAKVGLTLGANENAVGIAEGKGLGEIDGSADGDTLGNGLGNSVGIAEGKGLGDSVSH